ncbi:hypothetical protein V8D89_003003 [Ganoderma adspersum]
MAPRAPRFVLQYAAPPPCALEYLPRYVPCPWSCNEPRRLQLRPVSRPSRYLPGETELSIPMSPCPSPLRITPPFPLSVLNLLSGVALGLCLRSGHLYQSPRLNASSWIYGYALSPHPSDPVPSMAALPGQPPNPHPHRVVASIMSPVFFDPVDCCPGPSSHSAPPHLIHITYPHRYPAFPASASSAVSAYWPMDTAVLAALQ